MYLLSTTWKVSKDVAEVWGKKGHLLSERVNNKTSFVFRIPNGTSAELANLLNGLLKRDARIRMDFDTFFNHPFIRPAVPAPPPQPTPSQPVNVPSNPSSVSNSTTPRNSAPCNSGPAVPGALPPSPVAMSKFNVTISSLIYKIPRGKSNVKQVFKYYVEKSIFLRLAVVKRPLHSEIDGAYQD